MRRSPIRPPDFPQLGRARAKALPVSYPSRMTKHFPKRRKRFGEKHQRARYSDARVSSALDLLDSGMSQRAAAARLGIPRTTLQAWASGAARAARTEDA